MKNSIIFWNSLYVLGLVIFGFIFLEGLLVYLGVKSVLFFATCIDGNIESSTKYFRSYYLNFFTGIVFIIWCIVMGGDWLYKKVIKPVYDKSIGKFNKFLNNF